jgi:hypothetical protein
METNYVDKGLNNIRHMYDKLNYFDQYGATIILFIIITFAVVVLCAYFYAKTNIQPIINDWPNQRCKPYYLPLAGFITKPENMSATDYTLENFNYCTQNILSSITGVMVQPLTFAANTINNLLSDVSQDINSGRAMFNKVRTFFQTITEEIMGRLMNIMIPLQKIIISFRDMIGKIQGTMTAGLFTMLGSYYTLQSLMGAIAQFLIIILIAMAALIVVFWILPFTWGAAISMTAVFVAISIPLAIMLTFMMDVLQVQPDLSIPTLKCFDKNTKLLMKDGKYKKISDICIGDDLYYDGLVTAKMKVDTNGSIMYRLNDIIVSNTHLVYYKSKWLRVEQHPDSVKIDVYTEPYLYCLNTTLKTMYINNTLFSDWDEAVGNNFIKITHSAINNRIISSSEIHKFLDTGLFGTTPIKMQNNEIKEIKTIEVGDILVNGEKVLGIVEIDGKTVEKQNGRILGKNIINSTSNLYVYDKNKIVAIDNLINAKNKTSCINEYKLYHLITDKKSFFIYDIKIGDYNVAIDSILEKL